jgi:hypothetical protein
MARKLAESEALAPKKPAKAAASKTAGKTGEARRWPAKVSMASPARQKPKPNRPASAKVIPQGKNPPRKSLARRKAFGLTL